MIKPPKILALGWFQSNEFCYEFVHHMNYFEVRVFSQLYFPMIVPEQVYTFVANMKKHVTGVVPANLAKNKKLTVSRTF